MERIFGCYRYFLVIFQDIKNVLRERCKKKRTLKLNIQNMSSQTILKEDKVKALSKLVTDPCSVAREVCEEVTDTVHFPVDEFYAHHCC